MCVDEARYGDESLPRGGGGAHNVHEELGSGAPRRGDEGEGEGERKDEDRHKAEPHGARRHLREREGREHTARREGLCARHMTQNAAQRDATSYRHCMTRRRPER